MGSCRSQCWIWHSLVSLTSWQSGLWLVTRLEMPIPHVAEHWVHSVVCGKHWGSCKTSERGNDAISAWEHNTAMKSWIPADNSYLVSHFLEFLRVLWIFHINKVINLFESAALMIYGIFNFTSECICSAGSWEGILSLDWQQRTDVVWVELALCWLTQLLADAVVIITHPFFTTATLGLRQPGLWASPPRQGHLVGTEGHAAHHTIHAGALVLANGLEVLTMLVHSPIECTGYAMSFSWHRKQETELLADTFELHGRIRQKLNESVCCVFVFLPLTLYVV